MMKGVDSVSPYVGTLVCQYIITDSRLHTEGVTICPFENRFDVLFVAITPFMLPLPMHSPVLLLYQQLLQFQFIIISELNSLLPSTSVQLLLYLLLTLNLVCYLFLLSHFQASLEYQLIQ